MTWTIRRKIWAQVAHFRKSCHPAVPEWYETKRKTTHVVFWS